MNRKLFLGLAVIIALLVGAAVVSRGQQAPAPSPAPKVAPEPPEPAVAPEPPEPAEAPEPPDPPELPESDQMFVLNDGAAHLGVTLGDVTTEKAQAMKLPAVAGAIVNTVQKDSAAAKAGIKAGDAIIEFDAVRVRSSAELRRLIRETPAGRTVAIKIVRDGKTSVLSAKLETSSNQVSLYAPETRLPRIHVPEIHIPPMEFPGGPFAFAFNGATLGISADNLTPQLAQYFGVKQGKGVLVAEVTAGGAADKAGLKAGDVIVQVEGKPVTNVEELRSSLNENFAGDTRKVNLTIVRDRHEQTVSTELARSRSWEDRTSLDRRNLEQVLEQVRAQADQQREQAKALRDEMAKQNQDLHGEWRRQLEEQMRALKDQLKQMQDLRVTLRSDGEI